MHLLLELLVYTYLCTFDAVRGGDMKARWLLISEREVAKKSSLYSPLVRCLPCCASYPISLGQVDAPELSKSYASFLLTLKTASTR